MNYQTDVCIIGAGPGGALLAYLLAKQNISTILIERSDELGKEFRGEHLNEDGEMILKKHHILEEIESVLSIYINAERFDDISSAKQIT